APAPAKQGERTDVGLQYASKEWTPAARLQPVPAAPIAPPPSLDLRGAQDLLDPGTALLAYSVGPDHTLLFVVTGKGLAVRSLPIGREALVTRVTQLRLAIGGPRRAPAALARLDELARGLYRDLVEPGGPAATD